MHYLGYELPRILIPRTPVNKGKKKGQSCFEPRPSATFANHYFFFCTLLCLPRRGEEPLVVLWEGIAHRVHSSRGDYCLVGDPGV